MPTVILMLCLIYQVRSNTIQSGIDNSTEDNFIQNLEVTPFLDGNHYIRLNISWGHIEGGPIIASFKFSTSEECNQISEVHEYFLEDDQYIIVPSMELTHPADYLVHRCKYEITIEDDVFNNHTNQTFNYVIPECVQDLCECTNPNDSPYKISEVFPSLHDGYYYIIWEKHGEYNLTIHEIYYQTVNSKVRTHIPEHSMRIVPSGVEIPMSDLTESKTYEITVIFADVYGACNYFSVHDLIVPEIRGKSLIVSLSIFVIISLAVTSCVIVQCSSKSQLDKLKKYFSGISFIRNEDENEIQPVARCNFKEEVSFQYTPYEFLKNRDKYDGYEVPRNKVVLEEEIGRGAFGTVYRGKLYGLELLESTTVAVKLLRDGAPQEETIDFLREIMLFKKIGHHENIVKLLACVTMSQPYMMVMELVSKDSLKTYLLKLRQQWDVQKNNRIFFPEDMNENSFQDTDSKCSDGQYIIPDDVFDDPESPSPTKSFLSASRGRRPRSLVIKQSIRFPQPSAKSPVSITSSRLPSSTDTETTTVELESPFLSESKNQLKPILSHTELQKFAFDIASGMAHLEKLKITHRDLAARNILMANDKKLKISDFGLSREGPYARNKSTKLPLRWMAIEAIETRICDNKSDVWSFGVVLWEIGTLGAFPYESERDHTLLHSLTCGKRLERPEICTTELYELMLKCWSSDPAERPTFQEIKNQFTSNEHKIYVNFDVLNPCYVFPSADSGDE